MQNPNRGYKSYADFQREALRPGNGAGWSLDELDLSDARRQLDFDLDPFEAALREAESDGYDYD